MIGFANLIISFVCITSLRLCAAVRQEHQDGGNDRVDVQDELAEVASEAQIMDLKRDKLSNQEEKKCADMVPFAHNREGWHPFSWDDCKCDRESVLTAACGSQGGERKFDSKKLKKEINRELPFDSCYCADMAKIAQVEQEQTPVLGPDGRPPLTEAELNPPEASILETVKAAGRGVGSALCWLLLLPVRLGETLVSCVVGRMDTWAFGTHFTSLNYYFVMARYGLAGAGPDTGVVKFWEGIARKSNPKIADGPGPNTIAYYGHAEIKYLLEKMGGWMENKTAQKGNELGVQMQNDVMWPDAKMIGLGMTQEDHAFIRPLIAQATDDARKEDQECDGSTCWNSAYLRKAFAERFSGTTEFKSTDIRWFCTKVLHKILLNMDLSDEQAEDFIDIQMKHIAPMALPPGMAHNWLIRKFFGIPELIKRKEAWLVKYGAALSAKFPDADLVNNHHKRTFMASAFADALLLAGGLSVPFTINNMVALLHTSEKLKWPALKDADLTKDSTIMNFAFEAVRRYPPVASSPFWIQHGGNKAWKRVVPVLSQACRDERVFPEPMDFRLDRPGHNAEDNSLSIAWADFALMNGDNAHPTSHACPAKKLSLQVILAFMQEFLKAGPWTPEPKDLKVGLFSTTAYTMKKDQGM